MQLEIRKPAADEIRDALADEPLENAALVVRSDEGEECCGVGFDVLLLRIEDIPEEGYRKVGSQYGWPVYVAEELVPREASRLVINVDRAGSRLAAVFLEK